MHYRELMRSISQNSPICQQDVQCAFLILAPLISVGFFEIIMHSFFESGAVNLDTRLYQATKSLGIYPDEHSDYTNTESISTSGLFYDGSRKGTQRLRYRGDIVLRPLISQNESNDSSQCHASSDYQCDETACKKRPKTSRPSRKSVSHSDSERNRSNASRSSWPWSWLAMTLLVTLSLASLIDIGRCQIVLATQSKGTSTSTISTPINSTSHTLSADHQNRREKRVRAHSGPPNDPLDGDWDGDEDEKHQRMNKATFRQLSRMAFKALVSEDFQDRPLRAPDDQAASDSESMMTPDQRKQFRRRQRKLQRQRQQSRRQQQLANDQNEDGDLLPPASDYNQGELIDQQDDSSGIDQNNDQKLPGRRRAIAIATKDSIKPDACRTVPLKQRVRMTGCTTKIVVSHFCYGQCNSFYIPKLSKKRLRAAFESCSVCRPKIYVPVSITLHCPSRNPPYVKRKIMKVKECSCMPAHISENDVQQP